MVDRSYIRVTALAVLPNEAGTHHAVMAASDPASGERFHRPLGGGVELGERAVDAVVREIAEELGATLVEPRLLGVLENIFTYEGEPGHEIVFVFDARLVDHSLYARDLITGEESNGQRFEALWLPVHHFDTWRTDSVPAWALRTVDGPA